MAWAEFEEKEYETAVAIELADGQRGRGLVFSAGQVLESIVGYDAAAAPVSDHVIWRLLSIPRPKGVRLVPATWVSGHRPARADLPRTPVSLILQYKRPEFLYGARAAQWKLWGHPYYRFSRTTRQHTVLNRLERRLGGDALVRYAAPVFWRRGQLEAAHIARQVLGRSGFVSPVTLGRHFVWTYAAPGIEGRVNPGGRTRPFETVDELLKAAFEQRWTASLHCARRSRTGSHTFAGEAIWSFQATR
jgi:hypothetical protein